MGENDTLRQRTVALTLVVLTVVGLGVAGAGAVAQDDAEAEDAQLRVAHLSPDAPAVDVLVDGEMTLEAVEFGAVSDYLNVSAGEHQVTIQTAENDTVVFDENVSVEAGTRYTVGAIGEVGQDTFDAKVFVDDYEMPSEDNATVRLIHASPDAPAVDVTVAETGDVLYENVSFSNASDYMTVPAGDYTLEIRPAGAAEQAEPVATFDVSLEGGAAYSAVASGYLTPEQAAADVPFGLIVASDAGKQMTMGNETTTEM